MGILSRHKKEKKKAGEYFNSIKEIDCPYFSKKVIFNSDGFHHLQFSAGRERGKKAQILKFSLLKSAVKIIENSGTVQEYRKEWGAVGRKKKGGFRKTKEMQYWGLTAITGKEINQIRVRVILRQVGNGNVTFWSVMPDIKLKNKTSFKLAEKDITNG